MDLQLRDKIALVGGGSRGIGRACVESLLAEGVRVAFFARQAENVAQAEQELCARYGADRVCGGVADYTDASSIQAFLSQTEKIWGAPTIFIASSGGPVPAMAATVDLASIQNAMQGNVFGMCALAQRLLPGMQAAAFGRLIFITTSGVVQPLTGLVTSNMARSALTAFAKTLASEVAADGITVNTVMPGKIDTQRLAQITAANAQRAGVALEAQQAQDWKTIPMGRYGRPEELADLVTFLASPKASYITGSNLAVDGGLLRSLR